VSEVEKEGPGAKAGMKAGDVIVSMGSVDVDDIDDMHWALMITKQVIPSRWDMSGRERAGAQR